MGLPIAFVRTSYKGRQIVVALNLIDHTCIGVGLTQEEATENLISETNRRYGTDPEAHAGPSTDEPIVI